MPPLSPLPELLPESPLSSPANPSPIVASVFDGVKPSGTTVSPSGVTIEVVVAIPPFSCRLTIRSRRRASCAGVMTLDPSFVATMAVDWTSLSSPRLSAICL